MRRSGPHLAELCRGYSGRYGYASPLSLRAEMLARLQPMEDAGRLPSDIRVGFLR